MQDQRTSTETKNPLNELPPREQRAKKMTPTSRELIAYTEEILTSTQKEVAIKKLLDTIKEIGNHPASHTTRDLQQALREAHDCTVPIEAPVMRALISIARTLLERAISFQDILLIATYSEKENPCHLSALHRLRKDFLSSKHRKKEKDEGSENVTIQKIADYYTAAKINSEKEWAWNYLERTATTFGKSVAVFKAFQVRTKETHKRLMSLLCSKAKEREEFLIMLRCELEYENPDINNLINLLQEIDLMSISQGQEKRLFRAIEGSNLSDSQKQTLRQQATPQ